MFNILIGAALLATACSLFAGLATFWKGGENAKEKSNQLMRWRLFFQGMALFIFSLALFFHK